MPLILDGKKAREAQLPELKKRVAALVASGSHLTLAVIQVGDRADSAAYIRGKNTFAGKVGVTLKHVKLPDNASQGDIIGAVRSLNADDSVQGIIVQLPMPAGVDKAAVIEVVDPAKDVDALTSANVVRWSAGKGIMPATARGVKELLDYYKISLKGRNVVVVGRSELVGAPVAAMCRNEGAAVTVCHSKTPDLAAETLKADIIIVAIGKPSLIGAGHVKVGQVVIDVGISRVGGESLADPERLVGDVDFNAVAPVLGEKGSISPVPGGVGAMTVLGLFENLADLSAIIFTR